jgi:hypothetical protein
LWLSGGCSSCELHPVQKHFVTLSGLLLFKPVDSSGDTDGLLLNMWFYILWKQLLNMASCRNRSNCLFALLLRRKNYTDRLLNLSIRAAGKLSFSLFQMVLWSGLQVTWRLYRRRRLERRTNKRRIEKHFLPQISKRCKQQAYANRPAFSRLSSVPG